MKFWNGVALVSGAILLSLIILVLIVAAIVFLVRKPMRNYKWVDLAVFDWLDQRTGPRRNKFILFITFLGNHKFLVPANILLLVFFMLTSRYTWFSIRVAAIGISSLGLMLLLKALFRRKRPLAPLLNAVKGLSFPSGHAIMSLTFYGLVIYILYQLDIDPTLRIILAILLVVLILLIGFSRIYLRVHYLSDVLAGFLIGTLWLMISLTVLNRLESYAREKSKAPPSLPSTYSKPLPSYHQTRDLKS